MEDQNTKLKKREAGVLERYYACVIDYIKHMLLTNPIFSPIQKKLPWSLTGDSSSKGKLVL